MNRMIVLVTALFTISTSAVSAPNATSGYNILTCEGKTISLDEGHSLTTFSGKGVLVSVPGSADHMSSIECVGTVENMPDKSFKASGYCSHTDRDGDKWIDHRWNDFSMKKGRWEQTGISGKYKVPRSTGTFVYTDLSSESGCKGVSNWEADR
jgi:hypothetical protein